MIFIGRLTTQLYCLHSKYILNVQGSLFLAVEVNAPAVDVNIALAIINK